MKFKRLNESSFGDILEKEFGKNCVVYDSDGGRWWHIEPRKPELFPFEKMTIGPLDEDLSSYSDFRNLISIRQSVVYSLKYEKSVINDLRDVLEYQAERIKRLVRLS